MSAVLITVKSRRCTMAKPTDRALYQRINRAFEKLKLPMRLRKLRELKEGVHRDFTNLGDYYVARYEDGFSISQTHVDLVQLHSDLSDQIAQYKKLGC